MFDVRNTETHPYDDGLLADFDSLRSTSNNPQSSILNPQSLYIFHLLGQHVSYKQRYPARQRHFRAADYEQLRPALSASKRSMLAHYDNATLYNDSIVDAICQRFEGEDAIVIYVPDHGEECYEPGRDFICRNHSAAIDADLAHYEFEIPLWIWVSHRYAEAHPEVFRQVIEARNRRLMIDALPHTLLYLAGIHTQWYRPEYDVLSPEYNENRPRLLKATTDYDKIRHENK